MNILLSFPEAENVMRNPKPASLTYVSKNSGPGAVLAYDQSFSGPTSLFVQYTGNQTLSWFSNDSGGGWTGDAAGDQEFTGAIRVFSRTDISFTNARLVIHYTDTTTTAGDTNAVSVIGKNRWQRIDLPHVAGTAGKTIRRIEIQLTANTTFDVYVGGADVRRGQEVDSFVVGDGGEFWSWAGTANDSNSLRSAASEQQPLGSGGIYSYETAFWLVDRFNRVIGEISEFVNNASISVDSLAPGAKATINLGMSSNEIIQPWEDTYIRPHLKVTLGNGEVEGGVGPGPEGMLGIYSVEPASERYDINGNSFVYQGYDLLWLLDQETFIGVSSQNNDLPDVVSNEIAFMVNPGDSYRDKIVEVLQYAGFPEDRPNQPGIIAVPPETDPDNVAEYLFGATVGQSYLEFATQMADAGGWERPWMNMQGKITTIPRRNLDSIDADRIFESGDFSDVRWPFEVDPEPENVANRLVVIAKHTGYERVYKVVAQNKDNMAHPLSYARLGRWIDAPKFEAPSVANIDRAKLIAETELEKMSMLPYTVRMKTRAMLVDVNEVYDLNLSDVYGDPIDKGQGKYFCVGWQLNLASPWEMTHNLRRLVPVFESPLGGPPDEEEVELIDTLENKIKKLKRKARKAKKGKIRARARKNMRATKQLVAQIKSGEKDTEYLWQYGDEED